MLRLVITIEGSTKRRYYAVLHIPPVDSPEKAVRATIVQDARTSKIKLMIKLLNTSYSP
jgi:hypothetical protein